ncbi:hypothetical protein AMTRI_Chr06g196990 [Amborella trichopoda]
MFSPSFPRPSYFQSLSLSLSLVMATDPRLRVPYPLEASAYRIVHEIGQGLSSVVYLAECLPLGSTVAIKALDLDRAPTHRLDDIRCEAQTMTLLSHPNVLTAHCSFTVDHSLWVVMPFCSAGSLHSILSASFPSGFDETVIAIVLRDTVRALNYLHQQGHVHRDIKAGNILLDSKGLIKVADFGVSASLFDPSSLTKLQEMAGTPYWMAPEVIDSAARGGPGYDYKADVWSLGITALELAHGKLPRSDVPLGKAIVLSATKPFPASSRKKFSKAFREMVGLCLTHDPVKRPSASKLLKHSFFKHCKSSEYLVKHVLSDLPSVEVRFKAMAEAGRIPKQMVDDEEDEAHELQKTRRISGWNFDEDCFRFVPVFPFQEEQGGKNQENDERGAQKEQDQEINATGAQKEQDQAKNHEIDETGAQKEQDQANNQEIEAEEESEEAKNQEIRAGGVNKERESGDQEEREGETNQEGGEAKTVVSGGRMAAMIPELERILEHSEAQRQGLVRLVDMFVDGRREVELLDLLGSLQLEHDRLTSELEILTKRNEELQRQWEEATGVGRIEQPDMEGANPELQEP